MWSARRASRPRPPSSSWPGPPPALVLLDAHLPPLAGLSVLGAIRADPRISPCASISMSTRSCVRPGPRQRHIRLPDQEPELASILVDLALGDDAERRDMSDFDAPPSRAGRARRLRRRRRDGRRPTAREGRSRSSCVPSALSTSTNHHIVDEPLTVAKAQADSTRASSVARKNGSNMSAPPRGDAGPVSRTTDARLQPRSGPPRRPRAPGDPSAPYFTLVHHVPHHDAQIVSRHRTAETCKTGSAHGARRAPRPRSPPRPPPSTSATAPATSARTSAAGSAPDCENSGSRRSSRAAASPPPPRARAHAEEGPRAARRA